MPPKKSSSTAQNWREKQILLIGKEEFNKQEAAKRRARRAAKANPPQQPNVKTPEFTDLIIDAIFAKKSKLAEQQGHTIKKSTVKQLLARVKTIHKLITPDGSPMVNFEWLRDVKKIISAIDGHYNTPESKNTPIRSIASLLGVMPDFKQEYKIYGDIAKKRKEAITGQLEKNKLTPKEAENFIEWGEIQKIAAKARSNRDKALTGLYAGGWLPPRRVADVALIKVCLGDGCDAITSQQTRSNWYDGQQIIYNVYKTDKTYGQQKIKVPEPLKILLNNHIRTAKIKNGGLLFGGSLNFSREISDTFAKFTKKNITVNMLRHSYISNFLKSNQSIEKKRAVAYLMANSKETQETYNRIL